MQAAQSALKEGHRLHAAGDFPGALSHYDNARSLFPKVEKNAIYQVQRGSALVETGEIYKGLECLDKAVALKPEHAGAWYKRGNALHMLCKYEDAEAAFGKACQLDPSMEAAHIRWIRSLVQLELYEKALDACKTALALVTKKVSLVHRFMVFVSVQLEREEEAAESANVLTELYQANPGGFEEHDIVMLSRTLSKVASRTSDIVYWQRACVVDPSFDNISSLGLEYLDRGLLKEARTAFELAARVSRNDWRAYQNLGLLEFKGGSYRASAANFQVAFDICSKTPPGSPVIHGKLPSENMHYDILLHREGQGRVAGRIQLFLGIALLNGGDFLSARHHISCAAHGRVDVREQGCILLAALDLYNENYESSMNILNLVANELHDDEDVGFQTRICLGVAKLACVALENLDLCQNTDKWEVKVRRIFELGQKYCAKVNNRDSKSLLDLLTSLKENKINCQPDKTTTRVNTDEKMRMYTEQQEKRNAFVRSLLNRRIHLEGEVNLGQSDDNDDF